MMKQPHLRGSPGIKNVSKEIKRQFLYLLIYLPADPFFPVQGLYGHPSPPSSVGVCGVAGAASWLFDLQYSVGRFGYEPSLDSLWRDSYPGRTDKIKINGVIRFWLEYRISSFLQKLSIKRVFSHNRYWPFGTSLDITGMAGSPPATSLPTKSAFKKGGSFYVEHEIPLHCYKKIKGEFFCWREASNTKHFNKLFQCANVYYLTGSIYTFTPTKGPMIVASSTTRMAEVKFN